MKIEKLEISNKKNKLMFFLGVILTASIFILINYLTSRANYRNTESIELAKGTINYSIADLNVIAMYKIESGKDVEITEMPGNGYQLNTTKSYCYTTNKEDHDTKVTLSSDNSGNIVMGNLKKGSKCIFYFEEKFDTLHNGMLGELEKAQKANYTIAKSGTGFDGTDPSGVMKVTGVDKGDNGNILYEAPDNDGTSYFFRGEANNNWVQFAGKTWRIIRINGDGTLRLIYQCGSIGCTTTKDATGTETQLTKLAYNKQYHDNTYVGYYNQNGTTSKYPDAHKGTNPSTIAEYLNTWYGSNLAEYNQYIDQDAGFCNDRQKVTGVNSSYDAGTGAGTSMTSYAAWGRVAKSGYVRQTQCPTLKCGVSATTATAQETSVAIDNATYKRDLFTKTGATKGNELLQYPIGLITADEVLLAGGFFGTANDSYYLYTNQHYWTMSPYYLDNNGNAYVFRVNDDGDLRNTDVYSTGTGVRPVINLKANINFSGGNGSVDTPFVVATN